MDIKIIMCCHKPCDFVPPLCVPVQGGAAINPPIESILHDNTGDNISEKNREYCELTALYYAWKNLCADYIGLCHYRRFFGFAAKTIKPYIALGSLSEKQKAELLGSKDSIRRLISGCDAVVPRAEDMGISVREHYKTSAHHFSEDLSLFVNILYKNNPELIPAAEEYLSQSRQYFCNMFLMKNKLFCRYCEILFPALEEFDKSKKLHGYFQGDRTDGYLAERFTGIYITYLRQNGCNIHEVCRVDIGCTLKKRALYRLLPPESRGRLRLKKILKKF